jgi:hypothetical protein
VKPSLSIVPSIYSLIWLAELVTPGDSPFRHLNPHFEATADVWLSSVITLHTLYRLTEDLVTDVVLPDKVAQKLLVDTGLVDNGGVPEGAAKLDGLE